MRIDSDEWKLNVNFWKSVLLRANLRNDLLDKVEEILRDEPLVRTDNQLMMRYLLGNTEIAPIVAKYLNKTQKIRDFLIENPRRFMWRLGLTLLWYENRLQLTSWLV